MATILPFIFLRSRKTLERLDKSLRETAAGLLLDGDDDAEEIRFGDRHPLEQLAARLTDRDAERLLLDDVPELRLHRLGRFVGDDTQAVAERQARLHAAHDDVHGVREFVDEALDALVAQIAEQPLRQA